MEVRGGMARFRVVEGGELTLSVYGLPRRITAAGLDIEMPEPLP